MTVEIMVSRREGQVTFAASALTCCRKVKGFVVFDAICRSAFEGPVGRAFWMIPKTGRFRLHGPEYALPNQKRVFRPCNSGA